MRTPGHGRLSWISFTEVAILVISAALYLFVLYGKLAPFYPIAGMLLFQVTLGIMFILVGAGMIGLYGKLTNNEREMHELIRIFRLVSYPILLLVLLHTVNISIANLLVGAGFLGIVVGLAAQTTLGNAFAGLSILYANPYKAGDKITFTSMYYGIQAPSHPHEAMFPEVTGTVRSIGIIYTRIMKDDSSLMYVPNSVMNNSMIQNQSRISEKLIKVRLEVPIETAVDLFRVKLGSLLSQNPGNYGKLMDLQIKISMISSLQDMGIIITARSKLLDYDIISQWLSETAIKSLLETRRAQEEEQASGRNGNAGNKKTERRKGRGRK